MLAANEAVARLLRERQRPAVFRVHEDPDFGKLFEFATLARSFGHEPGDLTNRRHVQKLLEEIRGQPHEHALKLGLLKSLQRADVDAFLAHFGVQRVRDLKASDEDAARAWLDKPADAGSGDIDPFA